MDKNHYIAVMGTMGSGKTTMVDLLAKELGWGILSENFGENKFLPRFYKNPSQWAFHSQTFYLMEKITQLLETPTLLEKNSLVQDATLEQYVFSYAQALFRLGHMDNAEWGLYKKIYKSFDDYRLRPDLIIYLDTKVPTLLQRIKKRDRPYERDISSEYVGLLNELEQEWLKENSNAPILKINTDKINFAEKARDKKLVVEMVRKKLSK